MIRWNQGANPKTARLKTATRSQNDGAVPTTADPRTGPSFRQVLLPSHFNSFLAYSVPASLVDVAVSSAVAIIIRPSIAHENMGFLAAQNTEKRLTHHPGPRDVSMTSSGGLWPASRQSRSQRRGWPLSGVGGNMWCQSYVYASQPVPCLQRVGAPLVDALGRF